MKKKRRLPFTRKQANRVLLFSMLTASFAGYGSYTYANPANNLKSIESVNQKKEMHFAGIVLDNLGDPLPGASIEVKGKGTGTTSDFDGKFSLSLPLEKSYTLIIRFVGMQPKEMVLTASNSDMKIQLSSDEQLIDEVIVTGYGTYKKSAYAGSASTVKTTNLKDIPATSVTQVLQGAAPGIQISSASGQPGSATNVNIRGMGSFNASNSPLYVIDGIPVISGDFSSTGSKAGLDILSTINNSDIENITVI
ncbi:MAG: carboxypeptidase-like regulatory domain-containing protein, partial [Bacteroidales bacterium]